MSYRFSLPDNWPTIRVGVSRNEYIDIHLPSDRVQGVQVPRWDTLVAMNNAYSYGRVGHRQGERGGDRLVKETLYEDRSRN